MDPIDWAMAPEDELEEAELKRAEHALTPLIEALRGLDLSPFRSEGIPALSSAPEREPE